MECLRYLESCMSSQNEATKMEIEDNKEIFSREDAVSIWNMCVKINSKAKIQNKKEVLETIANLRKKACEALGSFKDQAEMDKFWLRTAKAYMDCSLWEKAEYCFSKVSLSNPDNELSFNYHLWKTQLDFLKSSIIPSDFSTLYSLSETLPHEKFRLARFLYCEICKYLHVSKQYAQLKELLFLCQKICQNSSLDSLLEISNKSKVLLCQVYIDLMEIDKASSILDSLPCDQNFLFLKLKINLCKDNFSETQDIVFEMIGILKEESLLQAVDIMISANKLVDSCKALMTISEAFSTGAVYLKWFQILFSLYVINGTYDESLPYLNINVVISKLMLCENKDVEKIKILLWDYAQELYYRNRSEIALEMIEKHYFSIISKEDEHKSLEFCAMCYLRINDPLNAINILRELEQTPNVIFLIFKAKILIGNTDIEEIKKLLKNHEKPLEVLKELINSDIPNIESLLEDLSELIIDCLDKEADIQGILYLLCEKSNTEGALLSFLPIALNKLSGDNLKWFFCKAWNSGISASSAKLSYTLMILSVKIAEKGGFLNSNEGVQAILGAAISAIKSESLDQLAYIQGYLNSIQGHDQEIALLDFEIFLLTNQGNYDEYLLSHSINFYPYFASIALEKSKKDLAKKCLQLLVQANFDKKVQISAIKQLLLLSTTFEETEDYLIKAIEILSQWPEIQSNRLELQAESEWLLATSVNSGIKAYSLSQIHISERWLFYALKMAEISHDLLETKIHDLYIEVLNQKNNLLKFS
ncbi:unnamed protein product [Blepharisma stoltei]|uniref:Protein ZIP4 homolog n=1 Tax=Blepharisma stoltei TaxID=1481888 RepID=A0AAU9J2P8_9CILI|nr:unnamed protein product [Blepharisma stoltei]